MALARTWLSAAQLNSTASASTYATPSFTPAANSHLVAFIYAAGTSDADSSFTDTEIGAWTLVERAAGQTGDQHSVWRRAVGASPVAIVATFDCTGDAAFACNIEVFEWTGHDTATPVRQQKSQGGPSSETPNVVLASALLTGNGYCGTLYFLATTGATPPASWTEHSEVSHVGPTSSYEAISRLGGETGTTITWGAAVGGNWHGNIVEINAAGGATYTLAAETGSYVWTGAAAGLIHDARLAGDAGGYAWTGQDAGLSSAIRLGADAGSYAWTGAAAGLIHDARLAGDAGNYAWAGQNAGLSVTGPTGRDISAAAVVESLKPAGAKPVWLIEMLFDSGADRGWSGRGDLVWDGKTFAGVGDHGRLGPVEESTELKAFELQFEVSGVPPSRIATALSEPVQGRPMTVWLAFLGTDYKVIADPLVWFKGRMDTHAIELGETARVVVTATSRLADWDRPRLRRYTSASHNSRHPGDRFFEFAAATAERELIWGPRP